MASKSRITAKNIPPKRNNLLYDNWSPVHVVTGILIAWVMPPLVALVLIILWEPLEILILSPLLAQLDIVFGRETLRNSLSDIFFDVIGVAMGAWLLANLASPPFHIF